MTECSHHTLCSYQRVMLIYLVENKLVAPQERMSYIWRLFEVAVADGLQPPATAQRGGEPNGGGSHNLIVGCVCSSLQAVLAVTTTGG
jgi:hypothetical protein